MKEQEGPHREDQIIAKASCHVTHPHVHQVTDRALERGEGLPPQSVILLMAAPKYRLDLRQPQMCQTKAEMESCT